MTSSGAAQLPAGLTFEYLDEGGANVVFGMVWGGRSAQTVRLGLASTTDIGRGSGDDHDGSSSFGPDTPPPTELEAWQIDDHTEQTDNPSEQTDSLTGQPSAPDTDRFLLRVRKDVRSATSVATAQQDYEEHIKPLFNSQHVVEQKLVLLRDAVIKELNQQLLWLESKNRRPLNRRSIYLRQESVGLLVREMSARPGDLCMLEIKPKWLVQSATAPPDATRCRTCTLRACRAGGEVAGVCPLLMVSEDKACRQEWVTEVLKEKRVADERVAERLHEFLEEDNGLVKVLRDQQIRYNTAGLGDGDANLELRIAMTIRDCSMFVRVPVDSNEEIEARLSDLDLKDRSKLERWRSIEAELINGGWYMEEQRPRLGGKKPCLLSKILDMTHRVAG